MSSNMIKAYIHKDRIEVVDGPTLTVISGAKAEQPGFIARNTHGAARRGKVLDTLRRKVGAALDEEIVLVQVD
jgi:hypothetical protein